MMRLSLWGLGLLVLVAVLMSTIPAQAAFTPDQVWTFNWETYVDLQPGNSNVLSTNWDFTSNKWEEVYVDGDGVDNQPGGDDGDEHQGEAAEGFGDNPLGLDELTMTLSGLDPGVSYAIDAVVMSKQSGSSDNYGITAGFVSGVSNQSDYHCGNATAAHINRDFNDEWLARIPLGATTANTSGEITVYINENLNLDWTGSTAGSIVDGLIYRKQADIAYPSLDLITSADRKNGATDDDLPIGIHDDETDPLASDDFGLQLGARTFSDRTFFIDDISEELVGADYVRNFLNDKNDAEGDFSYDVTLTQNVDSLFLMVLVDDRFEEGGGELQAMVDTIVAAFANAGDFVDTGYDVDFSDSSTPHPLSAFGMMVPTKDVLGDPITYTFGATPSGATSTYIIAALEEDPTSSIQIPGDTNDDNIVDKTDAATMAGNWGLLTTDGYSAGDFNNDGIVNAADASIMAANWGDHNESAGEGVVPEPSVIALLLTGLIATFTSRRRR